MRYLILLRCSSSRKKTSFSLLWLGILCILLSTCLSRATANLLSVDTPLSVCKEISGKNETQDSNAVQTLLRLSQDYSRAEGWDNAVPCLKSAIEIASFE